MEELDTISDLPWYWRLPLLCLYTPGVIVLGIGLMLVCGGLTLMLPAAWLDGSVRKPGQTDI